MFSSFCYSYSQKYWDENNENIQNYQFSLAGTREWGFDLYETNINREISGQTIGINIRLLPLSLRSLVTAYAEYILSIIMYILYASITKKIRQKVINKRNSLFLFSEYRGASFLKIFN